MTDEMITKNEVLNDGKTIHLYYSEMYKEYVAYGFSAYLAENVEPQIRARVRPLFSYSESLQMPFVLVDEKSLRSLEMKMKTVERIKEHICLEGNLVLNEEKYVEWASLMRG